MPHPALCNAQHANLSPKYNRIPCRGDAGDRLPGCYCDEKSIHTHTLTGERWADFAIQKMYTPIHGRATSQGCQTVDHDVLCKISDVFASASAGWGYTAEKLLSMALLQA